MSADNRDAAVREAKRFIREVVRNDWEFNPSANPDGTRPSSSSSSASVGTLSQGREITEWRCREFDSSGSELEPQSSDQSDDDDASPGEVRTGGDPVVDQRRRRRRQMEEEMVWNEGLRRWIAQRNAWSGARTRRQIRAKKQKRKLAGEQIPSRDQSTADAIPSAEESGAGASPPPDTQADSEAGENGDASVLANRAETTLSIAERERIEEQQRRQDQEEEQSTAPDEETKRKGSTETSITEPDQQVSGKDMASFSAIDDVDTDDDDDEEDLEELLIPVAPPLISPSNPIRATINQSIYPSIYTKVVVQGMTPTVPVNLADLTKAMVQGWKADGQWPPKPAVTSIVLADDASVPKKNGDGASDSPTSRRKNSITNAMRKVFHNPFHRRGSSHDAGVGNGASSI